MRVTYLPCGPAANESERRALEHLKAHLQSLEGDDHWVLLTNLAFSFTHQAQSDEIDIIAIGPSGVRVIEVKHWVAQWVTANQDLVEKEADKVTNKARKIGTTLRRQVGSLPRVDGVILLSQDPSSLKRLAGKMFRGVQFCTLNEWKTVVGLDAPAVLSPQQVASLASALEPKSPVAVEGSLRRFAGYVNLEIQTPKDQRFHRIYRGSHPARQDRVVLHVYDLSASDDKNAEAKARREFEALQRLQLNAWAPRILDSYQDAPGYPGEMFFFSLVDPAAPNIEERAADTSWDTKARLTFARNAIRALSELHEIRIDDGCIVHRNLTPKSILVRHDNTPILIGFDLAKIPSDISVASSGIPNGGWDATVAPEVRREGLAAADHRSDLFSLCASLQVLFLREGDENRQALEVLGGGIIEEADRRTSLKAMDTAFSELLGESVPPPSPPPARYWTEDQVVRFRDRDYRIVSRLGSGGVGVTFKVIELDRATEEELGAYVAKVAHGQDIGQRVLRAYSLARSHLGRHHGLSAIFEVANEWQENDFIALMTWVEGTPFGEFAGVVPLLAEDLQETSAETLASRWLAEMCEALDVLHRNGLVHGDVSPRNMIVSGSDLVLTDYDFVGKIGEAISAPGTVIYSSTSCQDGLPAAPSDDFYSLASSFFHVLFDREPFLHNDVRDKGRGLNWNGVDRDAFPTVVAFMDKATNPERKYRFTSAAEALSVLRASDGEKVQPTSGKDKTKDALSGMQVPSGETAAGTGTQLREERVEWLLSLLQSYPGSRWGNRETRGLDTEFAAQTYVETSLESTLLRDIRERRVRLVVLCGNAGDGKTALLQHLAARLGLGRHSSSERVLKGRLADGLLVRMNLDGSAAWQGRSADEILDEFLEPFQQGAPRADVTHLLAINDGRLLEWIEGVEARRGGATPLTQELYELLDVETVTQESHIRFISLNQRSLVGGITPDAKHIEATFLERLLDYLYGGRQAASIWKPCQSCSAQDRCGILRAARLFGPDGLPDLAANDIRARARQRLFEAFQAVHLRGETHITVRELRAALVYILFGVHFCEDYHGEIQTSPLHYWDRAFSATSPDRQGEVLRELARFDPAFEAHPQIDRYLLSQPSPDSTKAAPHYDQLSLESARRRAYFEWTEEHIEQVAGYRHAIDLARGQHLRIFRKLPLDDGDMDNHRRSDICAHLCGGISRLEDLPPQALDRPGVVPLRITPRTPTETAFWVEKRLDAFRLAAVLPPEVEGMDRLHRQALLIYRYRDGREERLRLGADLFHLLLELNDGYQLGDVSTDDTFAHLSIFVQRLVREDEREMLAWNPMQDEAIHRISTRLDHTADGPMQCMVLGQPTGGDQS
jgi:serine/threonine protein kinase